MNVHRSNLFLLQVMTSTPNSSFIPMGNHNVKTAHNTIGQRKSKQRSKRTPLPLLVSLTRLSFYMQ